MAYLAQGGLRCVLDGHDGLRPLHAPAGDERPVQFFEGAAGAVCAEADPGAVRAVASHAPSRRWVRTGTTSARSSITCARCAAWTRCRSSPGRKAARARAAMRRAIPAKVARLVVLAPAYNRAGPLEAPNPLPASNGPMTAQSHADFTANWDRQVGCPDQYEPAASARGLVRHARVRSGRRHLGRRRAPCAAGADLGFQSGGRRQDADALPDGAGAHDKQVAPERVRELYADLGSKQKVFIDLACSSHNAMWEKNHLLLFKASLEWLKDGKVNGTSEGELKLGY